MTEREDVRSLVDRQASLHLNQRWLPWLMAGLALLQFLIPSNAWLVPLVAMGLVSALGGWWARSLRDGLSCRRTIRAPWAQVGDQLDQHFELVNGSPFPAVWIEIEDRAPDAPSLRRVAAVGAGEATDWRQEMVFWRRGHYTFGPLEVRTGDPFGLFTVRLVVPDHHEIVVHPPVLDIRLPPRSIPRGVAAGNARGAVPSRQRAISSATVRAWQRGDPLSHVHWRTTARMDEPYVKSFEREPSGDLWLVVDLDAGAHAGEAPESTLEYAVILAASLAAGALAEGRAVGLVGWGALPWRVAPARGGGHLATILRVLAELQPAPTEPPLIHPRIDRKDDATHHTPAPPANWGVALQQLAPTLGQSQGLLLITPTISTDWLPAVVQLRRRGLIPAVLLLDARTFGATDAPDPEPLRKQLAEIGVNAEIVSRGALPAVERRERYDFFITGHGRAIRRERGNRQEEARAVVTL